MISSQPIRLRQGKRKVSRVSASRTRLEFLREGLRVLWTKLSAALFVASVVTIINLEFNWLKAIDSYAFATIGNLSSIAATSSGAKPRAVVVLIDPQTYEDQYLERSPLDRCVLCDQLQAIYAARPDVVAIDFDFSPALWLEKAVSDERRRELACQEDLYLLMQRAATAASRIGTVLIEPFPASPSHDDLNRAKQAWRARMESESRGYVRFANADLPVNYGLTLASSDGAHSFASVVAEMTLPAEHRSHMIDPRAYRAGLSLVPIRAQSHAELSKSLATALDRAARSHPAGKRVVFLGGGYGQGDVFLTPLGLVYGVEVHAAAYASDQIVHNQIVDFILDIGLAVLFGYVIARCWRGYFESALSDNPYRRQLAAIWIVLLLGAVGLLIALLSVLSFYALAMAGIWLSPIPLAIGMLIDSFMFGSVEEAHEHLSHHTRSAPSHHTMRVAEGRGTIEVLRSLMTPIGLLAGARKVLWGFPVLWAFWLVLFSH